MKRQSKQTEYEFAEKPARELLERVGWTYLSRGELAAERGRETEGLLIERLISALKRINEWITDDQARTVVFNLQQVNETGLARNRAIHRYLAYGMPLTVDRAGRPETPTVKFFDFDHPEPGQGLNECVVTTQFRIRRGDERSRREDLEGDEKIVVPDLVLFVNGIPLVVMEAKSPSLFGVWMTEAIKQLSRYQETGAEWHGSGAPRLFDTNLLCVAHCGREAAFAPTGAPENAYAPWKTTYPLDESKFQSRFGVPPEGQHVLIAGLLNPGTVLEILRDFTIFEHEGGRLVKKLPRYQQWRAVRKTALRSLEGKTTDERGGVIWHTQGSGKSLTMLWIATKLRRLRAFRNPTVVVVTDRNQLDSQITRTFREASGIIPERASTTRELRELLMAGSGRTIMTTIQKFEQALGPLTGRTDFLNGEENLVVMVDEAHRTQYGLLAARMRNALPNAAFIGFTGTPIDRGFRRSTMGTFGGLIDSYKIPDAEQDGAVVPVKYEARLPELHVEGANKVDQLFNALFGQESPEIQDEIRRRYANRETISQSKERIREIALDIRNHFITKVHPNGFKAQVVAPSRAAALRYANYLNDFNVAAYAVITTGNNDGPEFDLARQIDEEQITEEFRDPNGEPKILVVVDKLLTGFDAPVEQVLYLDRSIREHALLQAIARVNRPCLLEGDDVQTEKTHGLVVDYCGISRELQNAFSSFEFEDVEPAISGLPAAPGTVIGAAADRAEAHFSGFNLGDPWSCLARFRADSSQEEGYKADSFEQFDWDYREFSRLMDMFLPDPAALAFVDRLRRLTVIRSFVRAQFMRENADIDWTAVSAKVKELLDSRISAEVRQLMSPISILDPGFPQKIARLPHDEARAAVMEHAIRAQINERIADNPHYYERLSDRLQRIIIQLRQQVIDAAIACTRFEALRADLGKEQAIASEMGLSPLSYAFFELLAPERDELSAQSPSGFDRDTEPRRYRKEMAKRIESAMQDYRSIVDWRSNLDVQREMRRDIKRILRRTDLFDEDELNRLAGRFVEIARRRI